MIELRNLGFAVATPNTDATYMDVVVTASNDSCVTILNPTTRIFGTSGNIFLDIDVTEACLATESITITVTDNSANNCQNSTTYGLIGYDPCTNLAATITSSFVAGSDFAFTVAATGGNGGYAYQWYYDTSVYETLDANSSVLALTVKDGATVGNTIGLICDVTANGNCEVRASLNYQVCKPVLVEVNPPVIECLAEAVQTECTLSFGYATTTLQATSCVGRSIDWSTLELSSTFGVCVRQVGDTAQIDIYQIDTGISSGSFTWSVADSLGIRSNPITINVVLGTCINTTTNPTTTESAAPIPVLDEVLSGPNQTPSTVITTNVRRRIGEPSRTASIDWSSFDFLAGNGQTRVSATELTGINGTARFVAGDKIEYTVSGKNENVDVVQFALADENGNMLNTGKIYYDFEAYTVPTLASSGSTTVGAGNSTTITLSDSSGLSKLNTGVVTSEPTKGSYSLGTGGSLIYTPNANAEGADSITLYYTTVDGINSNPITINFTNIYGGQSSSLSLCDVTSTVNLLSIISGNGAPTTGGTWTAAATNPDATVDISTPTAVDFTGHVTGVYNFTYSVTSGSVTETAIATVNFQVEGNKSVSFNSSSSAAGTIQAIFTVENIDPSDLTIKQYRAASGFTPPLIQDSNFYGEVPTANYTYVGTTLTITFTGVTALDSSIFEITYEDSCGDEQTVVSSTIVA